MRVHIVNSFTDRPFSGNPAGVCLFDAGPWPDDTRLQQIAAELNHPETAFARPLPEDAEADWELRWFTPVREMNLCGHATLATAHVLLRERGIGDTQRFRSRFSGMLTTWTHPDGTVTLDFPAAPPVPVPVPDGLADALGAAPEAAFGTGALGDLLTVLPDEAAVRALTPDFTALTGVIQREKLRGVIVTALAAGPGHDFASRFFSPADGIPEDPVTGSAHTALAPYWSERLGRTALTGLQVSARSGVVRTALHHDRVHLTGQAVTVLDGTLHV